MKKLLFLTLPFVLAACGSNYLYESTQDIPGDRWLYRDTLNFAFEVRDTTTRYNFYVDFDYKPDYKFQNIYLKLSTRYPNGKRLTKVRSFNLFDEQGASLGKCSSSQCHLRASLQDNAFFNQMGPHTVTIEQYMRTDSLDGLHTLGIAVEAIQK